MKVRYYLLLSVLSILFFSACQNTNAPQKETHYQIVIEEKADSLDYEAAHVLQKWWKRISQKDIEINHQAKEGKQTIFIGKNWATAALKDSIDQLKEDGFVIVAQGKDLLLAGQNSSSDMYAVSTFLEEHLACILLDSEAYFAPQKKQIDLSQLTYHVYQPDFSFRRVHLPGQFNKEYSQWYKLENLDNWGMFVHTFHRLVPPEKYFEKHPEYYSYIGGRRLQDAQLCLSNPDVIQLLIGNLREEIKQHPEKEIWSVSQNDAYNYCECENCKALYQKYEAFSGPYIQMANKIAQAFPDKIISTLAYQFTRKAPKNITIEPNVNIMFCSIECNRSQPFTEDKRSEGFVKDMKDWSALSKNIFLWDYVVQFKNYLCPFPNFHILQSNIQFFKNSNVNMIFEQGSGGQWSDLAELKQYLLSKLTWNTDLNVDSLIARFLPAYYGDAAPFIQEYYNLIHKHMKQYAEDEFLNIYGYPNDYYDSFLQGYMLQEYSDLMDRAEAAVKHDSVLLKRVWKTRLPVDFSYLDVALNTKDSVISFLEQSNTSKMSEKTIKKSMLKRLEQLEERSLLFEDVIVNERQFTVSDYCKYVKNKLEQQSRANLLQEAKISLKTKCSERYPVGGAKALKDGLLGDLDFHNNWLGFYGEDMLAIIEFPEERPIKSIQMNFLKAVNSWVFLPTDVEIELSSDGKTFHKVASEKGDLSDRNYLVKSIPFKFDLEEGTKVKAIKVTAHSLKDCPKWHRGFGNPSWIFIDEIIVSE